MSNNSTKPYLIRSIYEWCIDSSFTPFVSVKAYPELDVPMEYIKNGEIVFNISANAVHGLIINNESLSFDARFNGISRKLDIPIDAVKGIFAKEVNQGIAFPPEDEEIKIEITDEQSCDSVQNSLTAQPKTSGKPKLRIIK
ncbi:MAG: ClpXP protease specificity-enhancing factor [Nitrosomonas sp.]|uniref:ClpXP protease specificity-enhancing factor n=1 Tax=Nitrosomonas sp. TaxID=42353 RepID=UPI0025FB0AF0|nr:ClpXP protease specificity-enhancing factor [Nitrosomonas sp.]MCG7755127.1 ClpXP protease specificity-enhancing factor [Nitrosomonas sp.]UJP03628.1 MAG: ClpXP protease specificity-enhancing factor [Nitrosomonas sp.]UJP08016.1 MAG: ClpXP protease specificity-enhancing factor [Nitrosomonas sp.]